MKSKITLVLGLFALAFFSSSYIKNTSDSGLEYHFIKEKAAFHSFQNSVSMPATACAKCHDCTGQNVSADTSQVNLKVKFNEVLKSTKTPQTYKTTEVFDAEAPLQPDAFKNNLLP